MNGPMAERRAACVALACRIYQSRLDRTLFFRHSIFGDAGWDTLLAVYVFASSGRTLSAGELCNATTETSPTSALRMQRRLVDLGLLRRVEHRTDRRRILIELTEHGQDLLEKYLDHLLDQHFVAHPLTEEEIPELR
jgi:DNA-binding MarR family transcriptional regulator